jgi:hypothetical protein
LTQLLAKLVTNAVFSPVDLPKSRSFRFQPAVDSKIYVARFRLWKSSMNTRVATGSAPNAGPGVVDDRKAIGHRLFCGRLLSARCDLITCRFKMDEKLNDLLYYPPFDCQAFSD